MKEFFKNNKTSLILFFLFLSIALLSGIYSNNTKDNINSDQGRVSEQQSSAEEQAQPTIATGTAKIIAKPEVRPDNSAKTTTPATSTKSNNSGMATAVKENSTSTMTAVPVQVNGQTQILYVGDKKYEVAVKENSSVYDLMLALKQSGQLDFKGKTSAGLGFFVEEINGIKNDITNNTFWIYYINGKAAEVGISLYHLEPNDIITWKYEKSPF